MPPPEPWWQAMRRREFITLFSGAAVAWPPHTARAQQSAMPVVGFLDTRSPNTIGGRMNAVRQGLKEAGFVEGENVTIVDRWAEGRYDLLQELAAELVRRPVAVIATGGGFLPAQAAKVATATIPIVFSVQKTRSGLVLSQASPDRAAT